MPENFDIKYEVIDSKTSEPQKSDVLDALRKSESILAHLKESYWNQSEKYNDANDSYTALKKEIIKNLEDDRKITREELDQLKYEISFVESFDERDWDDKLLDGISNTYDSFTTVKNSSFLFGFFGGVDWLYYLVV